MMQASRRGVLIAGGCALALPGLVRPAHAAEFNYKLSHQFPAGHPVHTRLQEMSARVKAETGGQMDVEVFPSGQLGNDTDSLSQIRGGALEIILTPGIVLSTLVPAAAINGVGFAFADYDTAWKALDGELGAFVRAQIAKAGLVPMDRICGSGFRQITTSTKPIRNAADLRNVKMRVPVAALWTSMFKALGASPTSINFAEVYTALQTHLVDGQDNPLSMLETAKFYEVQKYCSLTNHMWEGAWCMFNRRAWTGLPADVQAVFAKNYAQAALDERADTVRVEASAVEALKRRGMIFVETDRQSFKDALSEAGFYKQWRASFGEEQWGLLEKISGKLA